MRATLHRFLLMLLMLALPLQGFASAAMQGCMAADAAQASLVVAPMDDAMMAAGCHEPEQPDSPPARHDCKHCAACALASALPIPILATGTSAIDPVSARFVPHPAASFSGFIPDGPERPPRPSRA